MTTINDRTDPTGDPTSTADADAEYDVAVVGAGIAGLAAALATTRAGARTIVVDAHSIGGRARTVERDGFHHNVGPHALYRSGVLAATLSDHGITVRGREPDVSVPLLLRDGALTPFPLGPKGVLTTTLLGVADRARLGKLLTSMRTTRPDALRGRSVDAWLGTYPARVRSFVDMLVRLTTYSNDPASVDAGAVVQQLQLANSAGVTYLHGGWGAMVADMAGEVTRRGGVVDELDEATAVRPTRDGWEVTCSRRRVRASRVVLASGGPDVMARLVGRPVPGAERLTAPAYASALDLAIRTPRQVVAFGLDRPLYLSAHAPVADLAPAGAGLVSLLRYTPADGPAMASDDVRSELRELARQAGIGDDDVVHDRYLHHVVVHHGAPSATGGGLAGRPGVEAFGSPGLAIAGDWVGPRGWLADASAASGVDAAAAVLASRPLPV